MSVFYHNDDPLLHQTMFQTSMNQNNLSDTYAQMYKQQLMMEMQQQQQMSRDWVGDLDKAMKELDSTTIEMLNSDVDFSTLNIQLQTLIQQELMNLVKVKIKTSVFLKTSSEIWRIKAEPLCEIAEKEATYLFRLARKMQRHGCKAASVQACREEAYALHMTGYPENLLRSDIVWKYAFK